MIFNVKTDSALQVLKKYREEHIVELEKAQSVWQEKTVIALTDLTYNVKKSGDKAKDIAEAWTLWNNKPVDNVKQYDKLIGAMEQGLLAGQEILSLEEDEYDRIFNDNFSWRAFSKFSNSRYGG